MNIIIIMIIEAEKRSRTTPPGGEGDGVLGEIGRSQRDQGLLQNPWVAGQQLLVACLACGMGIGATLVDCKGQLRFVLHTYNALRSAGAIQPLALLDWLMDIFADAKAIWHAGRPTGDFLQSWYLSMGMAVTPERGSSLRRQRKLVGLDPAGFSPAYRRSADGDFSDLGGRSAASLRPRLEAIQSSFNADKLVGCNLIALGAHFRQLPAKLVDALQLHEQVAQEQVAHEQVASEGARQQRRGKAKKKGPAGCKEEEEEAYTNAVYGVLTGEILFACETTESVDDMAAKRGFVRSGAPPESPDKQQQLSLAARVIAEHVGALQKGDYMLPC